MESVNVMKNGKVGLVTMRPSAVQVTYFNKHKQITEDIPYMYLLAVESRSDKNDDHKHIVNLHYIRPVVNKRLRLKTLSVQCDSASSQRIASRLQAEIDGIERPKRLAIIVNPNSGKKQGEKLVKQQVLPLFTLCGIQSQVIVTKAPSEAKEFLQTLDLSQLDGLVTVGGDGLYFEVMNSLILRTQTLNNVNVHDPSAPLAPTPIPIGIIPAGTGDVLVQYLHGTRDVMTAALRVVLGDSLPTNAVSLHQGGRLEVYSGLLMCFGLQGDMMADCEKMRWMGATRYQVVPITTVLGRRTYDVEVEYQDDVSNEVKRVSDVMYGVDTYVVSKDTKQGKRIQHRFGEDSLKLHLTSKCSLNKHVQHLTKLKDHDAGTFDYDFVHSARVQEYTVRLPHEHIELVDGQKRLKSKNFNINCDGEVIKVTHPEFKVRLHRHAVRLFGEAVA